MSKNNRESRAKLLAWTGLAAGLLMLLVALISAPALLAQDDPDADDGSGPIIITSFEDLQALPAERRARLQKGVSFGAADSYEVDQSTKSASRTIAMPGDEVTFTIVARNSGDVDTPPMTVVDTLPDTLEFVDHEFKIPSGGLQTGGGVDKNVITWEGILGAGGSVEILIVAEVKASTPVDSEIVNSAVVTAGDKVAEPSVTLKVSEELPVSLLPIVTYQVSPVPDIPSISATRPNSQNTWTVSWVNPGAATFELQEAHNEGFTDAVSMVVGAEASISFNHPPARDNMYYYRVRSMAGEKTGNWSEAIKVIGGYRDDYDVNIKDTTWRLRRRTHLDRVNLWNEFPGDYKWQILEVGDRFDLGLASPMREAPSLPYAIQLELKSPDPANMNGMGFVFAADKKTEQCPQDQDTVEGWYEHKDCFNQFYEVMLIENPAGEKRDLIVQRVAEVEWIGGGGSIPAHRKVAKKWDEDDIPGVSWGDWDVMRVEVFADRIVIYVGERGGTLRQQMTIDENMYTNNAYFGTIATTQERPKATARYEFFEVMPLD